MLPVKHIIHIGNNSADSPSTQYISDKYIYQLQITHSDIEEIAANLHLHTADLVIISHPEAPAYINLLRKNAHADHIPVIVCQTPVDVHMLDAVFNLINS